MGLVAPRPVGSSWTRDRIHVLCIGRRILNHLATREPRGVLQLSATVDSLLRPHCLGQDEVFLGALAIFLRSSVRRPFLKSLQHFCKHLYPPISMFFCSKHLEWFLLLEADTLSLSINQWKGTLMTYICFL